MIDEMLPSAGIVNIFCLLSSLALVFFVAASFSACLAAILTAKTDGIFLYAYWTKYSISSSGFGPLGLPGYSSRYLRNSST